MKIIKFEIGLMAMILSSVVFSFAQEKLSGLDLIQKVYDRPDGDDLTSELTMTLSNSGGEERVRKIKLFVKDLGNVE